MIQQVLDDSGCSWIYSIGTAGGSRDTSRLGDVGVTNAAHVLLQNANNLTGPIASGSAVTGTSFPPTGLIDSARSLLYPLDKAVTEPVLATLLTGVQTLDPSAAQLQLGDLVNPAIDPSNLGEPDVHATPGVPLLTTDYYYIASGDDASQYAVLEMDDAVIGYVAQQAGKPYAFVRNISDPVVPTTAHDGAAIAEPVRDEWSGVIYKEFGLLHEFQQRHRHLGGDQWLARPPRTPQGTCHRARARRAQPTTRSRSSWSST